MKHCKLYVYVWVLFIILLNIFLLLGSLFPSSIIEENVKESADILSKEGLHYELLNSFCVDNFTDSLMLNQAYSIDNKDPFFSYMSGRRNYNPKSTKITLTDEEASNLKGNKYFDQIEMLNRTLDGDIDTSIIYARYWHGWMPILRVLLIFFNIFMIYFAYLMNKKFGKIITIIFVYSLIVSDYFFVSYSVSGSSIYIIMMLASVILLKNIEKIKDFSLYFFIIGCITSTVDLLTVPTITLGIPLLIYILFYKEQLNFGKVLKLMISWGIGYGITWFSKWVIYDLFYKQGLIVNALKQSLFRASHDGISLELFWKYFLFKNVKKVFICICILYFLIIVVSIFKKKDMNLKYLWKKENLLILFVSMLPFIWYFAIMEHSYEHQFFTYKHIVIFTIGFLLYLNNLIYDNRKEVSPSARAKRSNRS